MVKKRVAALCSCVIAVGCADDPSDLPGREEGAEIRIALVPTIEPVPGDLRVGFVAYQEGDGEWKLMPGDGGIYKVRIKEERYGIAVACLPSTSSFIFAPTRIHYSTVSETTEHFYPLCFVPRALNPINVVGTASGLGALELGRLETADGSFAEISGNGPFTLGGPRGKYPLFSLVRPQGSSARTYTRVARLPDLDFSNPPQLAVDFSQGDAPVTSPLNLPPGVTNVSVLSSVLRETSITARMTSSGARYTSVPASQLREGDLIRISVIPPDDPEHARTSYNYTSAPGPVDVTFLPKLVMSAPTVPPTGPRRLAVELPEPSGTFEISELDVNAHTIANNQQVDHSATMSTGWRSASPRTYSFPDFSALPGYTAEMGLLQSVAIGWRVLRRERNKGPVTAGSSRHETMRMGTIAR